MSQPIRTFGSALCLLIAGAALVACGASGGSDSASPSTTPRKTSTTATSTPETTTTTTAETSTTTAAEPVTGVPDCQALLVEYSEVFTFDDLTAAATFFRTYAPFMPEEVGAASLRIADSYDAAGIGDNLDFGDLDLAADAQTFSDWTNDGCPAG